MTENNETKGTILLVDDLPENLQLLSNLLVKLGYSVRSVISGRMALKTVRVKQPDLILLDIKMPEMNGYEVCQQLKADPELQDIPVIFISALDDAFDKVTAFRSGGVDYITKPFQVEEVVARVENQLTIQRQKKLLQDEVARRREAEEILYQSRALLSGILNSALDGIAALQAVRNPVSGDIADFRCLMVNPVIARVFKRSREELTGKIVLRKFLKVVEPSLFQRFVNVVETGEALEDDLYYFLTEDSCWFHFVAVRLADGLAVTIRDITKRKEIELDLQQANRKLELIANLDGLTHVANRRRFNDYLAYEWQRHLREKKPLALILIDIDCFKAYNDYYGHQGGDDCLIRVAEAIAKIPKRSSDLVARYGGEEFAVVLSNTTNEGAMSVAESIREAIASLAIPHPTSNISEYVTLSLGIAIVIPNQNNSFQLLISQADQALYQAKEKGKNQTVIGF